MRIVGQRVRPYYLIGFYGILSFENRFNWISITEGLMMEVYLMKRITV